MAVNPLVVFVGLSVVTLGGLVVVMQQKNATTKPAPAVVQVPASTAKTEMQTQPLVIPESKNPLPLTPAKKLAEKPAEKLPQKMASLAPKQKIIEKPKPAPETAKKNIKPEPKTAKLSDVPVFDMVRVEKDGGAVVVGRAAPGADVLLKMNGKTIGKTKANEKGDWVFVPEQLIPQGSNELIIEATGKDKKTVRSKQSVFIAIAKGASEKPLIVVSKPGAPTKVLQQPEAKSRVAELAPAQAQPKLEPKPVLKTVPVSPEKPAEKTVEKAIEKPVEKPVKKLASLPAAVPKSVVKPKIVELKKSITIAKPARLTFDTVDYNDDGEIVFTGKATPDSTVRLYVDNEFVGDAVAGSKGNWLFRGKEKIKPGVHELRADLVAANGKVARRAAVPFVRANPKKVAALLNSRKKGSAPAPQPVQPPVVTSKTPPEPPEPPEPVEPRKIAKAAPVVKKSVEPPQTKPLATTPAQVQPSTVPLSPVKKIPEVATSTPARAPTPAPEQQQVSVATAPSTPPLSATKSTPPDVETLETAPADKKPDRPGPELVSRVVIQPGNNLWNISRVIYGRGIAYTTIYQANQGQIKNPDQIYPGQIFSTPGAMSTGSIAPDQRKPLAGVVDNNSAGN